MAYTVKKLAELSGVSIRTLHHYDAIGLLKPAYIGDNQYRYYEQAQLLMLQQILFYRELGFSLHEIQNILQSDDFDTIEALKSHRKVLEQSINRSHALIHTINKTLEHLEGMTPMNDNELYYGFDSEKQKQHEKYLVEEGIVSQEMLDECNSKTSDWTDKEKNDFIKDIDRIMKQLVTAIDAGIAPDSIETQKLMCEHYEWIKRTWTPDKESYLGLIDLYQTPEFRKFYDAHDARLLDYIIKAMHAFANSI